MARSNQERICRHEQATGMGQDKEKSYASQSKMCKKQVGFKNQAQQCVSGAPHCLWVKSSTRAWFFWKFSPVVNNITFWVLLLMLLHFGYSAKIIDVETAFLYGELEEEIYMKCPQGTSDITKDNCFILNKCIYVLVQAACQCYKKAVEILKSSGFVGGSMDPCLFVKKSAKVTVNVALYIDEW